MGRQPERRPRYGGDDERPVCIQQPGQRAVERGAVRAVYVARRPVFQLGLSPFLRCLCVRRHARQHRAERGQRRNGAEPVPRPRGRARVELHFAERDHAGGDLSHQFRGHGVLHDRHARLADDLSGKPDRDVCARRDVANGGGRGGGRKSRRRRAAAPAQGRGHHQGADRHRRGDVRT